MVITVLVLVLLFKSKIVAQERNKKICFLIMMKAPKKEFSGEFFHCPLVCVTDLADAPVLSLFEKDEEGGIEIAVSAEDTTGKSGAAFPKEQAQYDARKGSAADRRAILKIPTYGVLFGFGLYLIVDLIQVAFSWSDLKSLNIYQTSTGISSDSDRLAQIMSHRLVVEWIVYPIVVMEMITYGSILVWSIFLLAAPALLNIFKGTNRKTFAIEKYFDNDALIFYTCTFCSGYLFGTRCWWLVLGLLLQLYLSSEVVLPLSYPTSTSEVFLLLSFVQLCVVYGYLLLFPRLRRQQYHLF